MKKELEECDLWEFIGNKNGYFGITDIESFTDILRNRIKTFISWFNICRGVYYKNIGENISRKEFDLKIDIMIETKRYSTYCIEFKYGECYYPACNIKFDSSSHFYVEITKILDYIDNSEANIHKDFYTKSNLKDHDISKICTINRMPLKYDLYKTNNSFEKFIFTLYVNGFINRFYLLGGNKMSKTNNTKSENDLINFQKTTIDEVMKRYNTLIDKQTSDGMSIMVPQNMLKEFSKDSIDDRFFIKLLRSLEFRNNDGIIEAYTYVIDSSKEYHSDKMFSFRFCKSSKLVENILVHNEKILKSIHLSYLISKLDSLVVTTNIVDRYEGINFYDLVLVFIMNYIMNSWNRNYLDSDKFVVLVDDDKESYNKEEKKSEKYKTSSEQNSSFIKNRNLVKDFIENSIPETIEELKKNKIYQLFMNSDISTKDVEDLKNILVKLAKDAGPILPVLESLIGSNNKNCKKDKNQNCGGTWGKSNW